MEGEEKHVQNLKVEMATHEIVHIVRTAVDLGVSRVKLTGGEPLMRKDVTQIVKGINDIAGLTDLSMTTNGSLLATIAEELHANGLKRVNVNLPSLDAEVYRKLTGGKFEDAVKGIRDAVEIGFSPVKLNMLVLKGVNDFAVPEMMEFARETGTILQLIELELLNVSDEFYSTNHKPLDEYEVMLKQRAVKVQTRQYMQNRRIYELPNLKVEVIHPTENTEFCGNCTRLRVTSDGKLKPCLMRNDNLVDVLTPLRNGATEEELRKLFEVANLNREPYNKN
jgi:cyclic pyranopterin phosphate synthase